MTATCAVATSGLAPTLRMLMASAGTVLVARAAHVALRLRRDRTPAPTRQAPPPWYVRVVIAAARVASRLAVAHRRDDAEALPTRIAAAPMSWPARVVGFTTPVLDTSPGSLGLVDLVAGVRCLSAIVVAAAIAGPTLALAEPMGLIIGPAALCAGALLPDAVLSHAARRSIREAERAVPTAVDLLAASTSAALSLQAAMVLTAGHAPPPIAAALRAAAIRRSAGEDPRTALELEAARFRINALAEVALAVDRQRRLATPLGPELCRIAERLRAEHRARSLEHVARQAPVATLVVATVIAPLCVAALVACLIGGIVEGGTLGVH